MKRDRLGVILATVFAQFGRLSTQTVVYVYRFTSFVRTYLGNLGADSRRLETAESTLNIASARSASATQKNTTYRLRFSTVSMSLSFRTIF